jgi:hypothetical protein
MIRLRVGFNPIGFYEGSVGKSQSIAPDYVNADQLLYVVMCLLFIVFKYLSSVVPHASVAGSTSEKVAAGI